MRKSTGKNGEFVPFAMAGAGKTQLAGTPLGFSGECCHKRRMTVSIRPHHLLCMLTYLGKGYTPDFVANYGTVIDRLNAGEDIRIVDGPDEICQPMLQEANCHCHNDSVRSRDAQALEALGRLLGHPLTGVNCLVLDADTTEKLRHAFAASKIREACDSCEWQDLCSRIAQNKFRGCHLAPPD
nr:DUF1284 domain-containing protein [Roseibium sp. Sym1]